MRKFGILGGTGAAFVLCAVAAAGASANVWLHNGVELKEAVQVKSSGTLELHMVFLGAETTILCSRLVLGTVGPGRKDLVTEIHSLDLKELGLVKCVQHKGLCENPTLHAVNLPWNTELVGSPIEDHYSEDGKGLPGWLILCPTGFVKEISCSKDESVKFVENTASGAKFEFTRAGTEVACSTGTGWITGGETTEGFTVS